MIDIKTGKDGKTYCHHNHIELGFGYSKTSQEKANKNLAKILATKLASIHTTITTKHGTGIGS